MGFLKSDSIVVLVGLIAAILLFAAGFRLVALNTSSRNLILSFSAVIGVVLAFAVNCYFELRPLELTTNIGFSCPIDRVQRLIGTACLETPSTESHRERALFDKMASDWLEDANPEAFTGDTEKLSSDFAVYCVVGFFANGRNHWGLERLDVRGTRSRSSYWLSGARNSGDAHSLATVEEFGRLLSASGNLFSNAKPPLLIQGFAGLVLPPRTEVRTSPASVQLSGPVCTIEFDVRGQHQTVVSHLSPAPIATDQSAKLPDGSPRFETRDLYITIKTTFNPLRSQNADIEKYRAWSASIFENARVWFEGQ